MGLSRISVVILSVVAAICISCTATYAAIAPPSTDGWTLTTTVDGNNVSLQLGIDNAAALAGYQGLLTRTWGDPTLSDPSKFISLGDSGAVLRYLTMGVDGDPSCPFEFDVIAGASGSTITISSPLVSFATINSATGTATASVTVTDTEGDGATATGQYKGGAFYDARYNTLSSGQDFAFLIGGSVIAQPYLSNTGVQTTSPLWQTIGVPVSDMRTFYSFHLTANDEASGTSNFSIVPEPGSLVAMLTGLIGLAGIIQRRRR